MPSIPVTTRLVIMGANRVDLSRALFKPFLVDAPARDDVAGGGQFDVLHHASLQQPGRDALIGRGRRRRGDLTAFGAGGAGQQG